MRVAHFFFHFLPPQLIQQASGIADEVVARCRNFSVNAGRILDQMFVPESCEDCSNFSLGLLHLGEKSSNGKTWMDLKTKACHGYTGIAFEIFCRWQIWERFFTLEMLWQAMSTLNSLWRRKKKRRKKLQPCFVFTFGQRRWESQHFSILPDSSIVDENEMVANHRSRWLA